MHTDTRLAPVPFLLAAALIVAAILGIFALADIRTDARAREHATGTQAQVYAALDSCSAARNPFTGPVVTRDEQAGTIRISKARGNDLEDCLRRTIQEPQDAIALAGHWWQSDTHIPGEKDRARTAREQERTHAAHQERAQFLREHVVGYVTSHLDLEADAATVNVTQPPGGQWRHDMVIDLGDADVSQRARAADLIAGLRENKTLNPEDLVVVRATGWPDATF